MHDKKRTDQIHLLQQNLASIRKIAGWTAEELGNKIGVTKQTISNLENGKTTMTVSQYISIRTVIDYQIENDPENIALSQCIKILLDGADKISDEEYHKAKKAFEAAALAAAGGVSGATLATIVFNLLGTSAGISSLIGVSATVGPIGLIASGAAVGTALWVKNLLKKRDNQNEHKKK